MGHHVVERAPQQAEGDRLLVGWVGHRQHPLGPVGDLAHPTSHERLRSDRTDELLGQLDVAVRLRPVERGAQVGPQLGEAKRSERLVAASEVASDVGHLVRDEAGVSLRDAVGLVMFSELLAAELAHQFEQAEPTAERPGVCDHHRSLDEVAEQ